MNKQQQTWIRDGQGCLGIELGSTRIKAVLIGPDHQLIASGSHAWENQLENGIWAALVMPAKARSAAGSTTLYPMVPMASI